MFKAKFASSLFRELGGVQFLIDSFSLHGIYPVASWALKQEVGKNTRRQLLL